jgi:hypothetical protein
MTVRTWAFLCIERGKVLRDLGARKSLGQLEHLGREGRAGGHHAASNRR